jgi:hypothetical protein
MSNALAISGVTAVLEYILNNLFLGLSATFGSTVTVSSLAPDLVQAGFTTGGGASSVQNTVNLFLHQVTYNQGWRNEGLPSLAADGKTPLQSPPLALDLHYLLTAYGSYDWQAEALLGYALLQIQQFPVLARADITNAFVHLPAGNPLTPAVQSSGLADQIEMIKITPEKLGREELAWIWTALKADYRPTYPFQVSVVLMQPQSNVSIAFPVLTRNIQALPMAPAQILSVAPPNNQPAALPGDLVTVNGEFLSGAGQVTLVNQRLGVQKLVTLTASQVTNTTVSFNVPNDPANFPAGIYSLSVQFFDSNGNIAQSSTSIPIAVAPTLTLPPSSIVKSPTETVITVSCTPSVRSSQTIYLAINGIGALAQAFDGTVSVLTFQFSPPLPAGTQPVVLQVDEVASLLTFHTPPPFPAFGPTVTL